MSIGLKGQLRCSPLIERVQLGNHSNTRLRHQQAWVTCITMMIIIIIIIIMQLCNIFYVVTAMTSITKLLTIQICNVYNLYIWMIYAMIKARLSALRSVSNITAATIAKIKSFLYDLNRYLRMWFIIATYSCIKKTPYGETIRNNAN